MGDYSTLADDVTCYNVDAVAIGEYTTISQFSFLCTASHDFESPEILHSPKMPLVTAPIRIGDRVWVTADVFVGPGVSIGDGTVVLARSSVFSDLPSWVVASGTPARKIKPRVLRTDKQQVTQ